MPPDKKSKSVVTRTYGADRTVRVEPDENLDNDSLWDRLWKVKKAAALAMSKKEVRHHHVAERVDSS
jgi:hypothetical protein